jgi:molecular chaperone GrpE (heat shock protein)
MSSRRQAWETLCNLLARLEKDVEKALGADGQPGAALEELEKEIRRLGKAQFKANVLAQDQSAQWEQALSGVQAAQEQHDQLLETIVSERVAARERELLGAVLPALDGLESAIDSGRRYLETRDRAVGALQSSKTPLTPAQAVLISPADRAMLSGWLDGLRLVRERMLAILEAGDVTPIPAVGQPFDPYMHIAIGTTAEGKGPAGTIVAEERRGYRSPAGVLRYAEVIVYQPEPDES